MSIRKHVDDHNTTGIAQVSIRDRFRPCSRDSSGKRTTRKPNQAMQRRRTELANRHHAMASRQASVPCQKNKAMGTPSRLGVMPLHDVGLQVLFYVAALLDSVFSLFFYLMSPLSKDETGRGCSPVQFLWYCDHRHAG